MQNEITEEDFNFIIDKMELGEEYLSEKDYKNAFVFFEDALEKIPQPKEDWDISLDVFYELGNCSLLLEELNSADYFFHKALECPEGSISGKVWIGLGKFYCTQNLITKAQDAFMRAYMLEGRALFEDENKAFFKFIEEIV